MKRELPAMNSSPDLKRAMQVLLMAAIPEDMTTAPFPFSREHTLFSKTEFVGFVSLI